MNENSKTLAFVAVAIVALVGAWAVRRPAPIADDGKAEIGAEFFPEFQDPLAARTLQIIEFDEKTATVHPFRVTQVGGIWSLPSHENYPADADRQLAEAAASVMDLRKLGIVSDDPGTHELYGVVDPEQAGSGAEGVGTKVTLEDAKGKKLAEFIFGKQDPSQTGLRFVRLPGQDRVYVVNVSIDKLSTKFEDWIEPDLLKLSSFDIKQVTMRDYSVDELNNRLIERGTFTVEHDDAASQWNLVSNQVLTKDKGWQEVPIAPDEELVKDKLDELRRAVNDLKIVDVARKPAGLSGDLRADPEAFKSPEARLSLHERGFFVIPMSRDRFELFSNEGEVHVGMKTGVEYVLRFGNVTGRGQAKSSEDEADQGKGANRYIFVTARFNENLIPKPELEALPPGPAELENKPRADVQEKAADADQPPGARDEKAAADKPDAGKPDAGKPDADKPDADKPDADKPDADKPDDDKPDDEAARQREAIEKENRRKQDEYDDKVKEGKKKVDELNDRFADWYYVISDETYKKIHLSRADILKKKEAQADAPSGDDKPAADKNPLRQFEEIKQQGLND